MKTPEQEVALKLKEALNHSNSFPRRIENGPTSLTHLDYMCQKIIFKDVTGYKAHRWIGYIQGVLLCKTKEYTLEDMKEMNKSGGL